MVDGDAIGGAILANARSADAIAACIAVDVARLRASIALGVGIESGWFDDAEPYGLEERLLVQIELDVAAAAIANARDVDRRRLGTLATRCFYCLRRARLERVVILKASAIGPSESPSTRLVGGLCAECSARVSDSRRAAVDDLARTAARLEALLMLIHRGAARELASWWGGVGACTAADVNAASVETRRAIERLREPAR